MNLATLKTELALPAYSGLSDEAAADLLNVPNKQPDREFITGGQIASCVVRSELANAAVSAGDRAYILALFAADSIPVTPQLKTELGAVFGAGTTMRANLLAAVKRTGSRAEELGLGTVTPSHVADARRLP